MAGEYPSADFHQWEQELREDHPDAAISASDIGAEPYGADMLISPTSTAVELGVLACINGSRGSTVDDDLGSHVDDAEYDIDTHPLEEDVSSLS